MTQLERLIEREKSRMDNLRRERELEEQTEDILDQFSELPLQRVIETV